MKSETKWCLLSTVGQACLSSFPLASSSAPSALSAPSSSPSSIVRNLSPSFAVFFFFFFSLMLVGHSKPNVKEISEIDKGSVRPPSGRTGCARARRRIRANLIEQTKWIKRRVCRQVQTRNRSQSRTLKSATVDGQALLFLWFDVASINLISRLIEKEQK